MSISSIARVLLRRWYITLLGVVLTATLAAVAVIEVRPKYTAVSSVLLLPPTVKGTNPYMNLGAVPGVTGVLSRMMIDTKVADKFETQGVRTYTIAPDDTAGGPVIKVTGEGDTAEEALRGMRTVMAQIAPTLLDLQLAVKVPEANLITSRTIQADTKATVVRKSQTRAVIAAVALGMVLTLLLAGGVESLSTRRRRKHSPTDPTGVQTQEPAPHTVAPTATTPADRRDYTAPGPSTANTEVDHERGTSITTSAGRAPDDTRSGGNAVETAETPTWTVEHSNTTPVDGDQTEDADKSRTPSPARSADHTVTSASSPGGSASTGAAQRRAQHAADRAYARRSRSERVGPLRSGGGRPISERGDA